MRSLNRTKLSAQVASSILTWILDGRITPRRLLPSESSLAKEFGVSLPVIREAVRILETQGVVRSEHGRGVVVLEHSGQPLLDHLAVSAWRLRVPARDLWETRRALEGSIAVLAADRRTEEDLAKMKQALEAMRIRALEKGADDVDANAEFHHALATAAHNEFLAALAKPVIQLYRMVARAFVARDIGQTDRWVGPADPREWPLWSHQRHERVFEAIASRDGELARQAITDHFDSSSLRWGDQLDLTVDEILDTGYLSRFQHEAGEKPAISLTELLPGRRAPI